MNLRANHQAKILVVNDTIAICIQLPKQLAKILIVDLNAPKCEHMSELFRLDQPSFVKIQICKSFS